jgi:hypothetical protein
MGQPIQVIAPNLTLKIPVVDLQALPEAEREAEVLKLTQQDAQLPFDLAREPLLRVTLLKLGVSEHIVILSPRLALCQVSGGSATRTEGG